MAEAKANIEEHFVVVGLLEKVALLVGLCWSDQERKVNFIEALHSSQIQGLSGCRYNSSKRKPFVSDTVREAIV